MRSQETRKMQPHRFLRQCIPINNKTIRKIRLTPKTLRSQHPHVTQTYFSWQIFPNASNKVHPLIQISAFRYSCSRFPGTTLVRVSDRTVRRMVLPHDFSDDRKSGHGLVGHKLRHGHKHKPTHGDCPQQPHIQ